ncbi:16S rRNA (guanine(966)-N(2))-methyltransferase RsmD [Nocardioides donggukensis]|uniref:16S rRNA (Guanine(966)-N(2))-methyltransferase RsmD n=1 Tax=Nocardioides donggukensis TaxID=2774019 RepID=A0A927K3K9_9ACTN|nr:16S rRNA (guanine(966)-N(2))-methyltransferase RsmD [Nocardioides donggukensis]MBD8869013.1 16S rRNA (guanine(966)-N(2))-methyltransferase RsmD [Nocardioides donggukensis]
MTRIIGGSAGGRRLRTPPGSATRPTSDRVREALFSALEARVGTLSGLRFLDLYAGSGAIGLEARSRGAAAVTLVERDRRTARLISENATALGLGPVEVLAAGVETTLARTPPAAYDVVFLDPPYPMPDDDVTAALTALVRHGWVAPEGMVVVERGTRGSDHAWPAGLEHQGDKRYGESVLRYGRRSQGDSDEQHSREER